MALLTKKRAATFESINVGDRLPAVQRHETQVDIDNYLIINERPERAIPSQNLHVDEEFAKKGIFGGLVNYGVCTCAFMVDLLEMAFPTKAISQGTFTMRATEPIRADDVITYTGKVLDKRIENGKRLVDVEVTGTNQLGQPVAVAKATIPL